MYAIIDGWDTFLCEREGGVVLFARTHLLIDLHPPSDITYFSTASESCDLRFGDPLWTIPPPLDAELSPPLRCVTCGQRMNELYHMRMYAYMCVYVCIVSTPREIVPVCILHHFFDSLRLSAQNKIPTPRKHTIHLVPGHYVCAVLVLLLLLVFLRVVDVHS